MRSILLIGVSGCGKSSVGLVLAKSIGARFIEGDDYHPANNIAKMTKGIPLNNFDRKPWIALLSNEIRVAYLRNERVVLACSALKECYRNELRVGCPNLQLILLDVSRKNLEDRLSHRTTHFMHPSLLESQLAEFEQPRGALVVAADNPVNEVVSKILERLLALDALTCPGITELRSNLELVAPRT